MIPCVSGKCILSAATSRRLRPLPATAVERLRWTNSSLGAVGGGVTAMSLASRCVRRGHGRGLLLDLFDDAGVADLFSPVRVDEPPARLRPPAARLVVRLRVRDMHELGLLLTADVPAVL